MKNLMIIKSIAYCLSIIGIQWVDNVVCPFKIKLSIEEQNSMPTATHIEYFSFEKFFMST